MPDKTYPLGPWPLGIDNVSAVTSLRAGQDGRFVALRDAANVDVDRAGKPARRRGHRLATAQPGLTNLWACRQGAFAQAGAVLYRVSAAGGVAPLATLDSADPVAYCELNDAVVVTNRTTLLRIRGASAEPLGIADASAPAVAADARGGLHAGLYSVAVSFLRGDVEGGLSALRSLRVEEGQGIALSQLPVAQDADAIRVYVTEPGGETLYRVGETAVGAESFLIGAGLRGKDAPTQWLRRMPPGSLCAAWRGRLLMARNEVLYVSRPMAYHLYSPRHGFVPFASRIRMLAAVDAGVFVGTDEGVAFLRGPRPGEWVQESTGALPPIPGPAIEVAGGELGEDFQQAGNSLVAWLAPNGFVLGTNEGDILEPQTSRLRLPSRARARLALHRRRLTAAVR